jgi:hypothetical protein
VLSVLEGGRIDTGACINKDALSVSQTNS